MLLRFSDSKAMIQRGKKSVLQELGRRYNQTRDRTGVGEGGEIVSPTNFLGTNSNKRDQQNFLCSDHLKFNFVGLSQNSIKWFSMAISQWQLSHSFIKWLESNKYGSHILNKHIRLNICVNYPKDQNNLLAYLPKSITIPCLINTLSHIYLYIYISWRGRRDDKNGLRGL